MTQPADGRKAGGEALHLARILRFLGEQGDAAGHKDRGQVGRAGEGHEHRGEAALGIVYSTDAAAEPNVKIVGTFPDGSHPPIIYPAAVIKDAKSADAAPFLDYLKSTKARPSFEKQGFAVLVKSASAT